jgi:hypothetical protein
MRLLLIAAAGLISSASTIVQPANAMHGSGMNSGVYSSSAMAVQRERQEKAKTCARLRPNSNTAIVSYLDRDGRRITCP